MSMLKEPNELGLNLIDAIDVGANELADKIHCLNLLVYKTDISTSFKKEFISFLGTEAIDVRYTLLIYKERPHD